MKQQRNRRTEEQLLRSIYSAWCKFLAWLVVELEELIFSTSISYYVKFVNGIKFNLLSMNKFLNNILLLLPVLIISEQTFALKCGNRLVDEGDYKYKVAAICGDPDFTETRTIKFPSHCRGSEYYEGDNYYYHNDYRYRRNYHPNFTNCHYKTVDIWIYNFGPRKFMRELIFFEGIVKEINTLDYGY